MEQVSYNLRLDLKDTGIVNTGFRLKQGDSGMKISVSIFNRGVNVFDSTTVPKIVFKRPDGASVMANMTVGSSVYEYVFVGNELQQPGVEIMDVKFTLPNDRRESTVSCSFIVVPDTITPNTHGSDIYDNDLAELVAEATAAAETVEEVVGDSEAWAVGERNGVPVGPEDPAYHNNSKYWSEQANVTSLAALTDVDLDNPVDGDGLVYNSTTQKWENSDVLKEQEVVPSKNLLYNNAVTCDIDGIHFEVNPDDTVLANRTGTSTGTVTLGIGRLSSEYIGKTVKAVGCPAGGSATTYEFSDNGGVNRDRGDGVTFTYNNEYFQIAIRQTEPCNNVLFKPMITEDTDATYNDYEKYWKALKDAMYTQAQNDILGSKNVAVGTFHNGTENGITWTVDSDNVVTITSSTGSVGPANITSDEFILPKGTWILSKNPIQITGIRIALLVSGSAVAITYDEEVAYYASSDTKCRIRLYVPSTTGALNVKFYPMIRPSIVKDNSYAPPAMTNRQLTNREIKIDYVALTSKNITAGNVGSFTLPSTYDNKDVMAIIPIDVGPSGWGSTVPAVFSSVTLSEKKVSLRAYTTGDYAPKVWVIYRDK